MKREVCPLCGSKLKRRQNSDGVKVLICEDYPFCEYNLRKKYKKICQECGKMICVCERQIEPQKVIESKESKTTLTTINKIKKKLKKFYKGS